MAAPELDLATSDLRTSHGRRDGYADLRSYAPIGDTRTIALVALDGGIDWWPVPDLDSTPPFAALIDARNGGQLQLRPAEPSLSTTRRYLPGTNVLETTHTTPSGS
ncbi:MAG: trehalase-like domain-containing protein, partial [Propionibacteriaceae bacterium]